MIETIKLQQNDNGVATLTFNRPEALNALNYEAMTAFAQIIDSLSQDEALRVLILTGAGNLAFCSGGDLVELSQHPSADDARAFITLMGDALRQMEQLPIPVIAAINGYALGGGSEIALACDLRIVDEKTKMGMVQIKMGLTPGWGAGQRLLRIVGYSRAMALLLSGEVLRPPELDKLGLVQQIVPAGTALEAAQALAEDMAQQPPDVVRGIKALLQAGRTLPYDQALQTERDIFPPLWAADAHLDAVAAFLQRQAAKNKKDN